MKATLWLCSLVTTLVCVSQQVAAEAYTDTRIIQPQDNSLVAPAKRTKPSLSIVNPLDVLRQRIILEMARRQMRENTRQVERNKAILREIGKRSHGEFPEDENAPRLGGGRQPDHFYYQKLPFLRRYAPSNGERRLDVEEYELDPTEARKSTSSSSSSSRNTNNSNGNGEQINERELISTGGGSSSSSSSSDNRGALTLAQEQRQLEREQQQEAAAAIGQQELRFSDDRVMLPGSRTTDDRRDGGDGDDEYFESSNLLKESEQERQHQQQQQQDDKLKSDDYRLRYLYNIQDKLFG